VFDTQINNGKTNISTNFQPELDHNNSISAENISNKVTVDKVKQASNFRRPLFNAMMAYNNNYENIESSIFNDNYGLCHTVTITNEYKIINICTLFSYNLF